MKYYYDVKLIWQDYAKGCWAASIRMIYSAAGLGNPIGADFFFKDQEVVPGTRRPSRNTVHRILGTGR